MHDLATDTRSVVVEREFPYPPEKLWRALTQPHLIEDWLMKCDFKPVVGHTFDLRFEWSVVDCQVLEVEQGKVLSYTWGDDDLKTIVTWTLTPTNMGTNLRMEQAGFQKGQPRYYGGAKAGWPRFFDNIEQVLAGME